MKGNMRLDLDRIQYILLRTSVDILEDKKGGTPIIYNQECKGMPWMCATLHLSMHNMLPIDFGCAYTTLLTQD